MKDLTLRNKQTFPWNRNIRKYSINDMEALFISPLFKTATLWIGIAQLQIISHADVIENRIQHKVSNLQRNEVPKNQKPSLRNRNTNKLTFAHSKIWESWGVLLIAIWLWSMVPSTLVALKLDKNLERINRTPYNLISMKNIGSLGFCCILVIESGERCWHFSKH